ncbi:MAG: hypothetical protein ACJ8CB_35650 [Ktedonobacteraceae bacterium]|jgi:hypothetical protein
MQEKYFVSYLVYAGFGDISESRETFTSWQKMQFFMRQLRPDAVLSYGEIQAQSATAKVAA